MEVPFRKNVVVLTGASRGIGRSMARQLAAAGSWLALGARDEAALEAVAQECHALGGRSLAVPTDVASETECMRLVRAALDEYGRIDTIVANAGTSMVARLEDLEDVGPLERIMQVNFFGSVYCTFHALPHLIESRGRVVAVSSLAGLTGVPTRTGYSASKHAMAGFFDSLRIELRDRDVSVTVAYPGFVETGIRQRAVGAGQGRGREAASGRIMTPERCSRLILRAAWRRRRQIVMTSRGRAGRWLRLAVPGAVDAVASRAVGVRS